MALEFAITGLGALVAGIALVSGRLVRSPLPPTVVALAAGIALGPHVLGLIDLDALGERATIVEYAARLTLGIGLVGVALQIPTSFLRANWRGMATLIGVSMVLMWLISSALIWLVLGLPLGLAALIGAIVTATDPIAASPIVSGPVAEANLPPRIRDSMSFESGANDGLSYLFVFLPFLVLTMPLGDAASEWLTRILLRDVGLATLLGLGLGYVAGRLLQASERRHAILPEWRLAFTVALALLAVGLGRVVGSDEVLLVFAAGATFKHVVTGGDRMHERRGHEAVNRFFAVPIFALLGLAIPLDGWLALGWSGVVLVVGVVFLRRVPVILLLRPLLPTLSGWRDAVFVGWFGPIAVAAMYYASIIGSRLREPRVWDVVSLLVCASVVVHGVTATPFTKWFGRTIGKAEVDGDETGERAAAGSGGKATAAAAPR